MALHRGIRIELTPHSVGECWCRFQRAVPLNYSWYIGLDILNHGNKPIFVTKVREKVIDIALHSIGLAQEIKDWHVSEFSSSDYRYIEFSIQKNGESRREHKVPSEKTGTSLRRLTRKGRKRPNIWVTYRVRKRHFETCIKYLPKMTDLVLSSLGAANKRPWWETQWKATETF